MKTQFTVIVVAALTLTHEWPAPVYAAEQTTEDRVRSLENEVDRLTQGIDRTEAALERLAEGQSSTLDTGAPASRRTTSDNLVIQGLAEYRRGNLSAAWRAFTAAINEDPTNWRGFHNRGVLLFRARRFNEIAPRAFADLHEAIRLNPASAITFANRGLGFEMIGDIERAQRDYRIAGQLGMDCRSALRRLAGLGAERGRRSQIDYEQVEEDQDQEDAPARTPYQLASYSYQAPGGADDFETGGYGQNDVIAPRPPVLPYIGMTSQNTSYGSYVSTHSAYTSFNRSVSGVGAHGSRGGLPNVKRSHVHRSHNGIAPSHPRSLPHYVGHATASRSAPHPIQHLPVTVRNTVHVSRVQPVNVHPVVVRYPSIPIRLHR